jgi:hypothetical protein
LHSIDPNIPHQFDGLTQRQSPEIRQFISKAGVAHHHALLTTWIVDTLNRDDYSSAVTDVEVFEVDPVKGQKMDVPPMPPPAAGLLFCYARQSRDTLRFLLGGPFFDQRITIDLVDSTFSARFFAAVDDNETPLFRERLTDPTTLTIQVPARLDTVVLSDYPSQDGAVVYGRFSLTTDPFYEDYEMMQHGYLHKRYRVTAWFVCRLGGWQEGCARGEG